VEREVHIQQKLKHQNVVELVENFADEEKEKLYIVMEYMAGGSLQSLLNRAPNHRLPPAQVRKYAIYLYSLLLLGAFKHVLWPAV